LVVVAINLLIQPLAILICWIGVRWILIGISGAGGLGWGRIPDFAGPIHRVLRGLFTLLFATVISLGGLVPFLR